MKWIWTLVGIISLLNFRQASAQMITFTESVTASGSIGSFSFSGKTITLTGTADTSDIVSGPPGVLLVSDLTTTINIPTFGLATFADPISTFVSQGSTSVGFVDLTVESDILDTQNAAFATYNLASDIGPLSGPPVASQGVFYNTTGGTLTFSSISGNATFEAVEAPEPSSLLLEAFGALIILSIGRIQTGRCSVKSFSS